MGMMQKTDPLVHLRPNSFITRSSLDNLDAKSVLLTSYNYVASGDRAESENVIKWQIYFIFLTSALTHEDTLHMSIQI